MIKNAILTLLFGLIAYSQSADPQDATALRAKRRGRRHLGFISNNVCRAVRATTPGATCTCRGENLLLFKKRPLTINCVNKVAWAIPFIGTFTSKYSGSFYLFNEALKSSSKLCLTEVSNKYEVACIEGVHCQGQFDCFTSCKANVGGKACNSCNLCPDKTGTIVDCTNLVPFLQWSDCAGQGPVIIPIAPAIPVSTPVSAPVVGP